MKHMIAFEKFNFNKITKSVKRIFGNKEDNKIILALIEKIKSEHPINIHFQDKSNNYETKNMRSTEYFCIYEFEICELKVMIYLYQSRSRGKELSMSKNFMDVVIDNVYIDCKFNNKLFSIIEQQNLIKKYYGVENLRSVLNNLPIEKNDIDIIKKDIYLTFSS